MNKTALKSYAPQARRDFIEMVLSRAAQLGLAEHNGRLVVDPCTLQGSVAVINGVAFPAKVAQQRQRLIERLQREGFDLTLETIAYTWFNRLAALRYMELQDGFLPHGIRVLSSENPSSLPDILTHALELAECGDLPGLNTEQVSELKLASKDGELYKRLLVSQCNALSNAMPFLFERIDDETELLLPDNLLRTDSVVRKLVDNIEEADWQQVEVIGWLYQFYISEKKDQVIGKVVKSEDIPAATQLFTPNWIVKYLVQNSVGRLWLQANPNSSLATEWAYYIQPAEQTPEVQAELDKLIQSRIAEDGDSLNPESITVLDPACGSGHILVEAYDLLKTIYLERGYRNRDIPRLILEKNLFGLDIDDRAAQLAGFALLMKARTDDRRLFDETPKLNVYAVQDSHTVDAAQLTDAIMAAAIQQDGGASLASGDLFGGNIGTRKHSSGLQANDIQELIQFFEYGKTFGSLLILPVALASKLPRLATLLEQTAQDTNTVGGNSAAEVIAHYLRPAQLLVSHYDAVIANPPYMGSKGMNPAVKEFAKKHFPDSKSDLFAMFIERGFDWCKTTGFNSMVTMQSWMFLSSYDAMRESLLANRTIITMAHLGARAFSEISGEVVQTTAFVLQRQHMHGFKPAFFRLVDGVEAEKERALLAGHNRYDQTVQDDFKKIPGSPVAYWVSKSILATFEHEDRISNRTTLHRGISTGNTELFARAWHEVSKDTLFIGAGNPEIAKLSGARWFPYNRGGSFRKWYGLGIDILDYQDSGRRMIDAAKNGESPGFRHDGSAEYFFPTITWTALTSGKPSFRLLDAGYVLGHKGPSIKISEDQRLALLSLFNSNVLERFLEYISPTLDINISQISSLPLPKNMDISWSGGIANTLVNISKVDWDSYETSWGFTSLQLLTAEYRFPTLKATYQNLRAHWHEMTLEMQHLEEENNRTFIDTYGLQDELTPKVPLSEITLTCNPHYRYGSDKREDEREALLLSDTMRELVSYAVGCMFGRYSLDEPGLIYAHAGNEGFDPTRYATFPADADGIVPVSDMPWFPDDASERIREFLVAVWGEDTLAENLAWLADSLGRKADESPEEALRRYISGSFFKDHCQTYKKRPIYWLFSSGKQKAFEALVYLHRYNESTLARMRAEYVVPLTGKMAERIKLQEDDADKASSTVMRKKIDKEIDKLKKKLEELRLYDEKLRHFADQRITLDLDDGVKVNYGKFAGLLDGVKAITGGSGDE